MSKTLSLTSHVCVCMCENEDMYNGGVSLIVGAIYHHHILFPFQNEL